MYNSAGKFSASLKTFSSSHVFRPFIEQGASPPVLKSRGASPPTPGGVFIPGRGDYYFDHYFDHRVSRYIDSN